MSTCGDETSPVQKRRLATRIVDESTAGLMVKEVLRDLRLARRTRRWLVAQGRILCNDKPVFWTSRVRTGDILTVDEPEEAPPSFCPEALAIQPVWEDEHVLVVAKDAGMIVHPTGRHQKGTLIAAVAHHMAARGESGHPRAVHRLDRDTSGLLLFSKHKLAHDRLLHSLARREIRREYLAFLAGTVDWPEKKLTVDAPIAVAPGERIRRTVSQEGKPAITHFTLRQIFSAAVLVEARLETGRTHQIRVHAACIGHPVLGDKLYGAPDPTESAARQALHAWRLSFPHPLTEANVAVEALLPDDLRALEHRLANGLDTLF